jgi:hypothetical protein
MTNRNLVADEILENMAENVGLKSEASEEFKSALKNAKTEKAKDINELDDAELDHLAINQAIDHLISGADLLDASGLEIYASFVDTLLEKLEKNVGLKSLNK